MPLIFLAPLAFIGLMAIGIVVATVRGGGHARSGYHRPGTPMDPNTPLLLQQSELLRTGLNPSDGQTSEHHHQHHHQHHPDPSSGSGIWSTDPGNPGGAPHHHHG